MVTMQLFCKSLLRFLLLLSSLICVYETTKGNSITTKGFLDFLFSPCNKCKCGLPNREARLLGGEYLKSYEFPWLALIQIKSVNSVPGTLINDKYLITAASQVIGLTPFDLKVTLGQFDRCFSDLFSQNVSVETIILHKEFNPGNRAHDIALLKLASPVVFERRISPICLSTPGATYLGQVATVAGWSTATSKEENSSSCRPRKLGLPVLQYTECIGTAADSQFVSLDKGCAGIIGAKSLICQADAGGPIMYRSYSGVYELIGILSDKNDCVQRPSTALYTTVNHHLSWITSNTRDACYCLKT